MSVDIVKGGWSQEEDECLMKAIERYGTKWSMVSSMVKTRNSDQCAKRWTDTLNPSIDRTSWTIEEDALLLEAVQEQGNVWTKIVKTYFPGRTGLAAKNRYNSITRFTTDSHVARRKTSSTRKSRKSRRVSHSPSTPSESVLSPSTRESSWSPDEPSPIPSGIFYTQPAQSTRTSNGPKPTVATFERCSNRKACARAAIPFLTERTAWDRRVSEFCSSPI
ncbi:hypothetical protein D9758_016238 [Tetrapyrgos nigripes]|uniref:Uncharacterized protein n=1 Tax=Tetrapyrgos nigripes TaxID=182062 RepID=A0A8H5C637_9AGAR|nr:hypothetical protein D9758_016238 [Tetrapyrgos nigripes]